MYMMYMKLALFSLLGYLVIKKETEAALWHFHCDQLLSLEQSLNCGGYLVRWEKTLGIIDTECSVTGSNCAKICSTF